MSSDGARGLRDIHRGGTRGMRVTFAAAALAMWTVTPADIVSAQERPASPPTAAADGHAPVPEIASDRPGFNAPASVVPLGAWQLELGWAHSGGDDEHSDAPEPLLRIGVYRRVEMQVGGLGFETACEPRCRWKASDMTLGVRHALAAEPFGASLAVTGAVQLPVGARAVTAGRAEPSLILHVDRDIGGALGVSYNYDAVHEHDDEGRGAWRHGHGLSVEYDCGGWSPFVGVARRPTRDPRGVPWVAQAGTTRRLGRHVQADVTVDIGVTDAEPTWGIAAGLVVRRLAVDRPRRSK